MCDDRPRRAARPRSTRPARRHRPGRHRPARRSCSAPQDAAAVMAAVGADQRRKLAQDDRGRDRRAALIQLRLPGEHGAGRARSAIPTLLDPLPDPDITAPTASSAPAELTPEQVPQDRVGDEAGASSGFAGAGTIEFGGYDYHDGTRATGEVADFERGPGDRRRARVRRAQRPASSMIYVFSDGSLDSDGVVDNSVDGARQGRLARRQPEHRGDLHAGLRPGRPARRSRGPARPDRLLPHERRSVETAASRDRQQRDAAGRGDRAQLPGAARRGRPLRHGPAEPRPRQRRHNLIAFAPIRPTPP